MSNMHAHETLDHTGPERYTAARRVTRVSVIVNLLLTVAHSTTPARSVTPPPGA